MKSDTEKDFGGGRLARQASLSCRRKWPPVAWGSDVDRISHSFVSKSIKPQMWMNGCRQRVWKKKDNVQQE